MAPSSVHLPNGQTLTVTPVFGGLAFKSNELASHKSVFPPGWTVMMSEEDDEEEYKSPQGDVQASTADHDPNNGHRKSHVVHRYKRPSLQNDYLFISAISNPSNAEYKPPVSPTRQLAMMLWSTLWWYFHQPEPAPQVTSQACASTAEAGRPKGQWKINIKREGVFKGKNVLPKLERMGLITTENSMVGVEAQEKHDVGWDDMFTSRRMFWQLDARIYLFTMEPVINSALPSGSPFPSRPSSPQRGAGGRNSPQAELHEAQVRAHSPKSFGPFQSSSHLPTYYPPHPPQYTFTNNIRHPIRTKPFRQGDTFYCRYVPSVGQYLSFRVASLSKKPPSRQGPWSIGNGGPMLGGVHSPRHSLTDSLLPTLANIDIDVENDIQLLHKWMNDPRVSYSWGEQGPESHQEQFLKHGLSSRHSFPVIGCWNGKPFGYFEIYWVKEDALGKHIGGQVDDWDRGLHVLVGEQEFRGPHRVKIWLSALIHYCWIADMRTNCVMMEPRVDNEKLLDYCQQVGFYKEQEVTFPHKQSNVLKIRRDAWEKPTT